MTQTPKIRAIDFFCGAGGMSYGLRKAGIKVIAGIDADRSCKGTYESNIEGSSFLTSDVTKLSSDELVTYLGLKKGDDSLLLAGCSPCQFWSKINTDKTKSQRSAFLLNEFGRFVEDILPGWVVVENVPGIVNKVGSALPSFLKTLDDCGYNYSYSVLDLTGYGVPQTRKRFLLIANRIGIQSTLPFPSPKHPKTVRESIGEHNGFQRIVAGHRDETDFLHTASSLNELNLARIKRTPTDGGKRKSWEDDPNLQLSTYANRSNQFSDVYSRMCWDQPAPTVTTRFNSFSNGRFGHPEENRAISLREGATLQTFPKKFHFIGSIQTVAKQIGNAVPPEFAMRLGKHVKALHQTKL